MLQINICINDNSLFTYLIIFIWKNKNFIAGIETLLTSKKLYINKYGKNKSIYLIKVIQ